MIKNNSTFLKKKDDGKQNIHNTAKNINHSTVIERRDIIIKTGDQGNETPMGVNNVIVFKGSENQNKKNKNHKTGEKDNKTPMGVDNAIVFKGAENQNKKKNNNIMIGKQKSERKSLIEKIKDWFSSWSCSCDCKCIDNESEINLESNVDKQQNITPGE